MSIQSFTDKDLDNLIASIEESLDKAEVLVKSKDLSKDEDEDQEAMKEAPPVAEAAPAEKPEEKMPEEGMESQGEAEEAAPAEAEAATEGDEALESEAEEGPLSDEELEQIYGGMEPEELERHFMMIRQVLQSHYGQGEEPQEEAPEMPEQKQPEMAPEQMTQKSSKSDELVALKKTIEEQSKSIELLGKAFEALTKPQRKAVTEIEYIKKSEIEEISKSKEMSKDDLKDLYLKINPGSLSKSERSVINNYFLNGENKREVEHIIQSKGGKF